MKTCYKLCVLTLYAIFFTTLFSVIPAAGMIADHAAYTQVTHKIATDIPLAEALKQITAKMKVNFLYEELNIKDKKVIFDVKSVKGKKIEQVLTELLAPVGLSWSKIDDKNYSVFPVAPARGQLQSAELPPLTQTIPNDSVVQLQHAAAPVLTETVRETLKEVGITTSAPALITKSDRFIMNVSNSAMAIGSSLQLLKTAPFVKVAADNTVSLQGKKTMIMIDNKPIAETALENVLQALPAGNISSVELITNPSAKYDAAYGAVINIITKKSKIEGFTGRVSSEASTGKFGNANINTTLTYKYKALTLYGTGGFRFGDVVFDADADRIVDRPGETEILGNDWRRLTHQEMYNFQVGAELQLNEKQTLGAEVNGNLYNFNGPWTTNNTFSKQGSGIDSVLFTDATFRMPLRTYNYNLNYHLITDSGKNELTVLGTYTPWERNLFQHFPSLLYDPAGNVLAIPPTYQTTNRTAIDVYIAQADFNHNFNKDWKLESGLKYQRTHSINTISYVLKQSNGFLNIPDFSSNNRLNESISGAYGILSKNWKADQLQIGLRVEQTKVDFIGNFKQDYTNLFPTLFYKHNITDQDNVSFSYKRTITRTPYAELVPYSVFLNRYTVEQGNPALRPSYDNRYTVGTNIHKLNIALSYVTTSGMFAQFPFKQDFENKLTYFSKQNLDKAYDYSVFLYFPLRFNSWWETQNSGTVIGYNKAEGRVLEELYALSAFHSDFRSSHIFKLSNAVKLQVDAYFWTRYVQDLSRYSGYKNIDAAILVDVFAGKGQFRLSGSEILFKRNDFTYDHDFGAFHSRDIINTDSKRVSVGFNYKFGRTTIKSPNKKLGNEEAMKRL
jgi:iron complex outermembrane receptor protein